MIIEQYRKNLSLDVSTSEQLFSCLFFNMIV